MTIKMVVLYPQPADPEAFERYYAETHLPLVAAMPGLDRAETARGTASADGRGQPAYYRIAELYFADAAAMRSSFGSDEGKAVGRDLPNFAPPGTTSFLCELD
jgi:uncharacterized protein (TIGR02118 family)